jgi:hypothetical protein
MTEEQKIAVCAEAAHEMNAIYCRSLGDTSQPHWADAPDWQRSSAINGVRGVLAGNTPRQSHESWLREKTEAGWTYGPVKNIEKKQHPCFMPYDALPPEQQRKDALFIDSIRVMASVLGLPFDSKGT